MSRPARTRLTLVSAGEALTGVAPVAFERTGKLCRMGDAMHRGLLTTTTTIVRYGLRRLVAPSARARLLSALELCLSSEFDKPGLRTIASERDALYATMKQVEEATLSAVRLSIEGAPRLQRGALPTHAESVVFRYLRLSARQASEAVLMTLDGVSQPELLAHVVQHVAGACAYQATALGAARQPDLLERAQAQARFECDELAGAEHSEEVLALQVFHEYLGVRWKVLHDAERAYLDEFIRWALGGRSD